MSIERERLISLVEFAQQSARLRSTPASSITQHNLFALYEHQLRGLPGVRLSINGAETEDEVWLSVERLHERKPPEITSALLHPWVQMTQGPMEEPRMLEVSDGASLIAAGTHRSSLQEPHSEDEEAKPPIAPQATVTLTDYENAAKVKTQFTTYLVTKWRPWAEEEKLRRKTIRLYSHCLR